MNTPALNLNAVREAIEDSLGDWEMSGSDDASMAAAAKVLGTYAPALLAEVERLTAERDRMQDVRRLALNPGDTLVFEADRPLTMRECDMQAAAIKAAFPDHHVMVVDQGHFVVVEAANLTREQRAVIADPGT